MIKFNKRCKNIVNMKKFIQIRSMTNLNSEIFKLNLQTHPKYIHIMYDKDPETIANDIIEMVQDSLTDIAPVKRIKLSTKTANPLSIEAQEMLKQRNAAHWLAKQDPTMENIRNYKNLKNSTNRMIAKECYDKMKATFQVDGMTDKLKWKLIKADTGQQNVKTPEVINQ